MPPSPRVTDRIPDTTGPTSSPQRRRPGPWVRAAVAVGMATATISRRAGLGAGAIIGGRVTQAMAPSALAGLAAGRQVVLVSGTNGKTTTAHLLTAALRTVGPVAHNGLQILGTILVEGRGHRRDGLRLLDLSTTPGASRAVSELVSDCAIPGVGLLTGFENHRGTTTLGPGARPLGRVRSGVGNGAGHPGGAVDGAMTGGTVATYMHGPALADHLLQPATGLSFDAAGLPDVPDLPALRRTHLTRAGRRRSARWAARPGRT